MSNITLKLNPEETSNTQLELLIRILATQTAATDILIEMLAVDRPEAEKFLKAFDEKSKKYVIEVFDDLFARRGKIDLNEIFKQS